MRIFALSVLFLLAACTGPSDPHKVQGTWRIEKELAAAPIAGLSNKEATRLIGGNLLIDSTTIRFENRSCGYSKIEEQQQNIEEFLAFYNLDTTTRFPNNTLVLKVDCDRDFAIDQLLTHQDQVWFAWYGVLFEARRQ